MTQRPVFEKYMKYCIENKIAFCFEYNPKDIDGNHFSLNERVNYYAGDGKDLEDCTINFLNKLADRCLENKIENQRRSIEVDKRVKEINELLLVEADFEEDKT